MPLTYPLSHADFLAKLRVAEISFRLLHPQEHSQLGNGTVLSASLGDALWAGTIRLTARRHDDHAAFEALIALVDRPGATFLVHDLRKPGPAADRDGTILGAATPAIETLSTDRYELAIGGLPAGYVLSPGDMVGVQYGASSLRYGLHRIVTGGTASGLGITPSMTVVPAVAAGVTAGLRVQLIRPPCKARMAPGPRFGAGRAAISDGAEFDFVQTLR